jgi:type IV pilus assembly protein PilO
MTNLSGTGSPWQNYLTRQRVLVGAPLLVGVLIGAGLFAIAGLPHWLESGERTRRIAELKVQQQSLPLIEARANQEQQKLLAAQQQQGLVVNLVAGRGQIETFLTQLSRTATETGVVIERYEPAAAAPGVMGSPDQGSKNQEEEGEGKAKAPPEMKGYVKTAVLLQVRGPYVGVLQFLRAMEKLELLVQPSDLELKAVSPETNADGAPAGPPLTELKLRLSFFDKTTDGDQDANEPVESAPQSSVRAPS